MNRVVATLLIMAVLLVITNAKAFKTKNVNTGTCGQYQCPPGDNCCQNNYIGPNRQQCYSPYTHHCIYDEYKPNQNCLCGKWDGCCNSVCYDPKLYYCHRETGRIKLKTPPTLSCGQFQCPTGNLCCNNNAIGIYRQQCYNPYTHHCVVDQYIPSQNCLCGNGDGCCKGVCFDANRYKCYNGQIKLKY